MKHYKSRLFRKTEINVLVFFFYTHNCPIMSKIWAKKDFRIIQLSIVNLSACWVEIVISIIK